MNQNYDIIIIGGGVTAANFMGLGVDLVVGRDAKKMSNFQCPMSN